MADQTYTKSFAEFTGLTESSPEASTLRSDIEATDIETALRSVVVLDSTVEVTFKGTLSGGDSTTFDALVAAHTGVSLPDPVDDQGRLIVTTNPRAAGPHGEAIVYTELPIGGGFRPVSHNFCDATTWWQESTEHLTQATTTGDSLTYEITGHANIIDVRHGKLPFENKVTTATVSPNGNTMTNLIPVVYEDAVEIDPSNEDATTGDDRYTIDYAVGSVEFAVARTGTITVSFRKAGTSKFTYEPPSGKMYLFEDAEVDFSENFDMKSGFKSTVWISHTYLTGGAVVPYAPEDRIYKSFHDFQAAARRFFGPLPAGVGGTLGVNTPKWTFQWEYAYRDVLYPSDQPGYVDQNISASEATIHKIEMSTVDDIEWGSVDSESAMLTVTFIGRQTDMPS